MARVLSLSRCPSLSARVELSRAPLTLEHIKNAPYQVTPSTWYGAFSISYLLVHADTVDDYVRQHCTTRAVRRLIGHQFTANVNSILFASGR